MNKNKKMFLIISIALVSILLILGATYAAMSYSRTGANQQLVLGDIYMHYNEISGLSITDAVPGSDYSNYFEFIISGKNTYTKKDIYYDFILNKGDLPTNKTEENRIPDKYLKFKLVSVDDSNQETEIFKDKTYDSLENQRIYVETIEKNTTNEINRKYRLYMTIDYSLEIGNTETAVFTTDEWESAFASVKVNVTGDFNEKELPVEPINWFDEIVINSNIESCPTYIREDGITYISGTKDCIDFNYVWYSGKLWRITAIYPDGTMKMVTDENITTIYWGEKSTYSDSYMREWLNQEFLPTLYNYENIIVEDAGWYSITDSASTPTKPTGDYTLTDSVGLLNSYEYYMSYQNTFYEYGYLTNGYEWWLLNPYSSVEVRSVTEYGQPYRHAVSADGAIGVRPSVNLKSTIQPVGGTGTATDPYRIKGDQEDPEANVTLINTRQSGEYVKLENDETNQTFRIVDTELVDENLTTKIVLNDYVRDTNDLNADNDITEVLTRFFSSSSNLWTEVDKTETTYWRGYLNNIWIKKIDNTYNEMNETSSILEKGTYYLGYYYFPDLNYKVTVCSTVSSDVSVRECIENGTVVTNTSSDDYVGLLRVGEMFASQFGTGSENSSSMWLITPEYHKYLGVVTIEDYGLLSGDEITDYEHGTRPSINLKSTLVIKSGSGTKQNPYVVGLPN